MLWSDLREQPTEEARATQAKLRRAGWVIAVAMISSALLILRP